MAKKKKSVTQKKLENKIHYQQSKLRKIKKEFEALQNEDGRKKIEFKGKKRGVKYFKNGKLNEAVKINTEVNLLKDKLKRFKQPKKQKPLKFGEQRQTIGRAWDTKELDEAVLNNQAILTVNGLSVTKDKDKINDILNALKLKCGSKDSIAITYDASGDANLSVVSIDDLNEIEDQY